MRRRTCLQATGAGLAAMLAGCHTLPVDGEADATPIPTDTATPTDSSTESPIETERRGPGDVPRPSYLDLLPRRHLKGTENTPNAFFRRIDWSWYLNQYEKPMRFGVASEENWTLKANAGNLYEKKPPQYRILHTSIGTTIQQGKIVANILPQYPNLGPEIVEQCGFKIENESGNKDSRAQYVGPERATVKEVIAYAKPGVTYFVGIDVEPLKMSLKDNPQEMSEDVPKTTVYQGTGIASDRGFFISEAWERPVLVVETANEEPGSLGPAIGRVTGVGTTQSAFSLDSVQWGLSQFDSNMPVVVGQINGGRAMFSGTNYNSSPVRALKDEVYNSVFLGFDTSDGRTATAQVVISKPSGNIAEERTIRDLYAPEDGRIDVERKPKVVSLFSKWKN